MSAPRIQDDRAYLTRFPTEPPPPGRALVHNSVRHTAKQRPGINGFRAWLEPLGHPQREPCGCHWAGLPHFRVKSRAE